MALSQCTKLRGLVTRMSLRYYSVTPSKDIKKSVFISQSNDIFTNLALEDWLYKNFDFSNHHVLMLWRNNPCIVIGRHQNPWLEANVANLASITEKGVQLARRNSGGGTVYHDQGNLNLTFFTAKDQYNRKQNLELVTRGIFRKYGVKVDISPREDLLIRNSKVFLSYFTFINQFTNFIISFKDFWNRCKIGTNLCLSSLHPFSKRQQS